MEQLQVCSFARQLREIYGFGKRSHTQVMFPKIACLTLVQRPVQKGAQLHHSCVQRCFSSARAAQLSICQADECWLSQNSTEMSRKARRTRACERSVRVLEIQLKSAQRPPDEGNGLYGQHAGRQRTYTKPHNKPSEAAALCRNSGRRAERYSSWPGQQQ